MASWRPELNEEPRRRANLWLDARAQAPLVRRLADEDHWKTLATRRGWAPLSRGARSNGENGPVQDPRSEGYLHLSQPRRSQRRLRALAGGRHGRQGSISTKWLS